MSQVETTLVTQSLFPKYGLVHMYCVICSKRGVFDNRMLNTRTWSQQRVTWT
jgi:hypothetical protein